MQSVITFIVIAELSMPTFAGDLVLKAAKKHFS